jgi:hypothetical protein
MTRTADKSILLLIAIALVAASRARAASDIKPLEVVSSSIETLFMDRPVSLAAGAGIASSGVTFSSRASGALRPIAIDTGGNSPIVESGGSIGLGDGVVFTLRGMTDRMTTEAAGRSGALIATSFSLRGSSRDRLSLSVGYLRELGTGQGAFARLAGELQLDKIVLATVGHAEHVFSAGRDALDIVIKAGCYYELAHRLRFGAEYIGQDLEGWFEPEELEGLRQFVGPVIAWSRRGDPVQFAAGLAWGLNSTSGTLITRFLAAYTF